MSLKRNEIMLSNWKYMLLINDMILLPYETGTFMFQKKRKRKIQPWNYSTVCYMDQSMRTVKHAGVFSISTFLAAFNKFLFRWAARPVFLKPYTGSENITITTDVKILLCRPIPFLPHLEPCAGAVDASAATIATCVQFSVFKLSFNKATQNIPLALHFSSL